MLERAARDMQARDRHLGTPRVVTAHQPAYLPWLGLLHKLAIADAFIEFDDVSFDDRDFQNRNRILGPNGPMWLTVPVLGGGKDLKIRDARIRQDSPWRRKHQRSIEMAYGKTPFAGRYLPFFADLFARPWERLADLDRHVLRFLLAELGIEVEWLRLSQMGLTSSKSQLVLEAAQQAGAELFVFGASGRDYADEAAFSRAGVHCHFQSYQHPRYDQGREPFVPRLSAIDLLFRRGPESLEVLMSGNHTRASLIRATLS